VSFWVALVFSERLAFDHLVNGQYQSVWAALTSYSAEFVFVVAWILTLVALIADRVVIKRLLNLLVGAGGKILSEMWSPWLITLTVLALLPLIWINMRAQGATVMRTLSAWVMAVANQVFPFTPVIKVLAAGGALCLVLLAVSRFLEKERTPALETARELIASSYFVGAVGLTYAIVYIRFILPSVPAGVRPDAFGEMLKDTLIYCVVALAIVVGTYKAKQVFAVFKNPFERGLAFAFMALGTMVCAVPAFVLDVEFKNKVSEGLSVLYPKPEQRALVDAHIMIRDFVLLVPLVIVAFLRLLLEIVKQNAEYERRISKVKRSSKRAERQVRNETAKSSDT
jgi:hypothetical protein